MTWTYYIDDVEVHPYDDRTLGINDVYEDQVIRDYRKKLPGDIVLKNDYTNDLLDYDYIKTLETTGRYTKHTFAIHESGELHSEGEFTIPDVSFDDHKSVASVKITVRDKYTEIQEAEDVDVNVIEDMASSTITCNIYSYWYFYGVFDPLGTVHTLNAYENFVCSTSGTSGVVTILVTELIRLHKNDAIPSGWVEFADLGEYKVYQRKPVNFPSFNTGVEIIWSGHLTYKFPGFPTPDSTYNQYPMGLGVHYTRNCNDLWVRKSFYNGRANVITTKNLISYSLKDCLNKIIDGAIPDFGGGVVSTFLFADPGTSGEKEDPQTYYSGLGFSVYSKWLVDMSDFRRPKAYKNASINYLNWKNAIESICTRFKCRWHIDTSGNIRIEHVSYYDLQAPEITLTNTTRKYGYVQNDTPNREWYEEGQAWMEDFKKKEILYGTVPALNGMKEKTQSISVSTFYTDVDGLNQHIDELSDEGFVLIESESGAVRLGSGAISGDNGLQNAGLSMGNCLILYHTYEAYQELYTIDGVAVAGSPKWTKTQEIEFENDTIPNTKKGITTWIGTGRMTNLGYNLVKEGKFKAEMIYE
jgi:hypothetical protein